MEIALYVRVSTSRQQQTQTIEQQLDRLQAHVAAQPDWHLAEEHIYRDDGYSGAKLNRPGLDRLRERAAMAAFERVLITAPDRLARNYVHQMLLIDELIQRGCQVEFLDRPMSDDPHDQLLLQIRGAVAEYERNLIADRMRRGRQAKLRSGQLLPWTRAPYGYLLDPERPRDPARLRLDPVKVAVVEQIFAWYTDLQEPATLYMVAKRLSEQQIPTPTGGCRWNVTTIRGILRDPAYAGTAYSGRTQPAPARRRKSALQPVGAGESTQPAPEAEWIAIAVPAMVSQETFALAQERLDRNKQTARRNNTAHDYLLRGIVSCGACHLSCMGRSLQPGYAYYVCRGRSDALRVAKEERCTARYAPAVALDELVWQDLCRVLMEPVLITHELERAQLGEWLPQALQARRRTLQEALAQLDRQQARLLEVYLAEIIGRDEFERKRQEVEQTQSGLRQQLRHVEAQAQKQVDVMAAAQGIEAFCRRIQPTLEQLTFAQRRQLVELLIDRVIVSDGKVEIRYVLPTGPAGDSTPFCHLRLDYFDPDAQPIPTDFGLRHRQVGHDQPRVPVRRLPAAHQRTP
jgi:site-specific DNA recombinase